AARRSTGPPCSGPNCRQAAGSLRSPKSGATSGFSARQAFQACAPSRSFATCCALAIIAIHSQVSLASGAAPRPDSVTLPLAEPLNSPSKLNPRPHDEAVPASGREPGRLARVATAHRLAGMLGVRIERAGIADQRRIVEMRLGVEQQVGRIDRLLDAEA